MENENEVKRIIQIVPAGDGWRALFDGTTEPIAVWALVEMTDGSCQIMGYVAQQYILPAEEIPDFIAYLAPGQE